MIRKAEKFQFYSLSQRRDIAGIGLRLQPVPKIQLILVWRNVLLTEGVVYIWKLSFAEQTMTQRVIYIF